MFIFTKEKEVSNFENASKQLELEVGVGVFLRSYSSNALENLTPSTLHQLPIWFINRSTFLALLPSFVLLQEGFKGGGVEKLNWIARFFASSLYH